MTGRPYERLAEGGVPTTEQREQYAWLRDLWGAKRTEGPELLEDGRLRVAITDERCCLIAAIYYAASDGHTESAR